VRAEDFHHSARVCLRLPGYRRQLGEERAHGMSLFGSDLQFAQLVVTVVEEIVT
jgi:hypothetical protein